MAEKLKIGDKVQAKTISRIKDGDKRYWSDEFGKEFEGWFIGKTTLSNGVVDSGWAGPFGEEGSYHDYRTLSVIPGAWIWNGKRPVKVFLSGVVKIED